MAFDKMVAVFHKDSHFHTLELTDQEVYGWSDFMTDQFYSGVSEVVDRLEEANYEIVSVVVHYDNFWAEEMISEGKEICADGLTEFYELLTENRSETGSILAYLKANDFSYLGSWEDTAKFSGDSKSEIAQEWFNIYEMPSLYKDAGRFYPEYQQLDSLPYILQIDWESTLDNITADSGNCVTYLNGTYYMFGE
jgi:hypothetical protein